MPVEYSTGDMVRYSGAYGSDCGCYRDVWVRMAQIFPTCPVCARSVKWTLIEMTEVRGR